MCADSFDNSWRNKDDYGFLVCVVFLLVWRGVLEALKLAVIVASFVAGRIVGREFAMPFLQSSPFLPLMGAFGVDWVDDVLRYQRTYQDHLRFFAVQGMLNAIPFLALQLHYVNFVQKTGLDTLSYVSLVINFVLVPLLLVRACFAVYKERTARATLVAAIVAHSFRTSKASDASDSFSTASVDVEMTSVSRDRSLTWIPLDLSGSSVFPASPISSTSALSNSSHASRSGLDDGLGPGTGTVTGAVAVDRAGHGLVHQSAQLDADSEVSPAVAVLHVDHGAVTYEGRDAPTPACAEVVDDIGLLPVGAIKSDSVVHL